MRTGYDRLAQIVIKARAYDATESNQCLLSLLSLLYRMGARDTQGLDKEHKIRTRHRIKVYRIFQKQVSYLAGVG